MVAINQQLRCYIETAIIPQYEKFDDAHKSDHVQRVIENSLDLAQHYEVDINMVYVVAAYHDVGLIYGRDVHHIESAKMLGNDNHLRQWLSDAQVEIMGQAVEDHRASNKHEPRTIYGKIVAEADRMISADVIIRRTIQYGLKHYPNNSKEDHFARFVEHIMEKYAEGGYLKLWIPQSPNALRLKEFQQQIKIPNYLRQQFDREWELLLIKSMK